MFNKHLSKLVISLSLACVFLGCNDKDKDTTETVITVTPMALEVTTAEEVKTLSIQTDGNWIVTTQQDWIEILSPIGQGNGTAKIKVAANTELSARDGAVMVSSNNTSETVTVHQDGMDISVDATSIKVNEKSATKQITVTGQGEWTAESNAEWCSVEKEGNKLNVSISYNETKEQRTADITIKSNAGNQIVVTVTQSKGDGNPEPVFSVSSEELDIPAKEEGTATLSLIGKAYTVSVTTSSKSSVWDVSTVYADAADGKFITLKNASSRVGNGKFTFTITNNLTKADRKAVIKVECNTNGSVETYLLNVEQQSYNLNMASVPELIKEHGAEQSLGITITPELELAYESDVKWIHHVDKDVIKIDDNITDQERSGKLYIKLAELNTIIDSVEFSQQDGLQLPIPMACNSYVTPLDPTVVEAPSCASSIFSGGYVGSGNGGMQSATCWRTTYDKQNIQLSFYFRTENTGELNLGLIGRMNKVSDTARVEVSVGDISYITEVTGNTLGTWPVGKFKVDKAGYVRVNIKGIYSNTSHYPYITDVYVGGEAVHYSYVKDASLTYVTEKQIAASDAHWIKRGPSCHLGWVQPSGNTEYFYNEINVPVGQDVPAAYFMTTGGDGFYMGIQPNTKGTGKRNILFSVWNNENDPQNIKYSEVVRHGEKSKPNSFGHEGSGIQTWRYYDWDAGKTYATLVHVRPEVKDGVQTGNTLYTGYFWSEEFGWELIAEIRRPGMKSWYRGSYSFSENFGPHNGFVTRSVDFPNQWMRTSDGKWHEILQARVTADGCGSGGLRTDFYGGVRDGHFYLQNIGYIDTKINSGTLFSRPASGKTAPEIDFDALSKLGVWVNP